MQVQSELLSQSHSTAGHLLQGTSNKLLNPSLNKPLNTPCSDASETNEQLREDGGSSVQHSGFGRSTVFRRTFLDQRSPETTELRCLGRAHHESDAGMGAL